MCILLWTSWLNLKNIRLWPLTLWIEVCESVVSRNKTPKHWCICHHMSKTLIMPAYKLDVSVYEMLFF